MKYIEELINGDCFEYKNKKFLLTSDFRSNGDRLCYSLENGFPFWFKTNDIVNICPIYVLDDNNNIAAIKITEKTNV